jgi:hypothetical protein
MQIFLKLFYFWKIVFYLLQAKQVNKPLDIGN